MGGTRANSNAMGDRAIWETGQIDKRVVKEVAITKRYVKKNVMVKHINGMCYYETVTSNDADYVLNNK